MRFCRYLLAFIVLAALPVAPRTAEAYPSSTIDFTGHGFGHGRGMGQYGALGYAVDKGWNYRQILDHFYGGTSMGSFPNEIIGVRLTRFDNVDTIVTQEKGLMTSNAVGGTHTALRAVRVGDNTFRIDSSSGCGGPWTTQNPSAIGPIYFTPPDQSANADRANLLQVCESNGTRWLRGQVLAVQGDGFPCRSCTVNELPLESYVRGVIPRESPASWGDLGGGAGMNALRAQAVAARSYGKAEAREVAQTCDTTACQVYGGVASQLDGTFKMLESPQTDVATAETAGQVRRFSDGRLARTEFSSSTGGYTAGGNFPAVVDEGDQIASNPYRTWQKSVAVSIIEAKFGIGRLVSFEVTQRNGLGDWGGRVKQVKIVGTSATVYRTGNEVRSALDLRSDWFRTVVGEGYWIAAEDGAIYSFGSAAFYGSMGGKTLARPVVGMEATKSRQGYWMVASDGGIFSFGDAGYHGSTGGMALRQPIVGMARTASGNGYWLVASDGGIFSFGDAGFYGSTGAMSLKAPVVGMASTPSGNGYWLVASDGGIFTFGDGRFLGSMGAVTLAKPVTGMASTPSGSGYYMVAKDGGIFTFGDARFYGSVPGVAPSSTTKVGMSLSYPLS